MFRTMTTARDFLTGAAMLLRRQTTLQRASTLILVPAMTVVFIVLAGIAVDLSAMHLAQRRTHTIISVAADDAAGMIDDRALQLEGEVAIDPEASRRVALAHINAAHLPAELIGDPQITIDSDRRVLTVEVKVQTDHIFLKSVPGMGPEIITVRSSARLRG